MESIIIVALVVVFALGLIVGTRAQNAGSGSTEEITRILKLVSEISGQASTSKKSTKKQRKD